LDKIYFSKMKELLGKIFFKIDKINNEIYFYCTDGYLYTMKHDQDCCESVSIDDINGDLNDLIGYPLTLAEESSSKGEDSDYESSTWTFYRFATSKGYVDIKWFGVSNGYYSESVSFFKSEEKHTQEFREYKLDKILDKPN